MREHPCVACVDIIFFGVRAVFGFDACHLFPQHVLTIMPLIGDVQVQTHSCYQEGRSTVGSWLWDPWWWWAVCTPGEVGVAVGAWSQDP